MRLIINEIHSKLYIFYLYLWKYSAGYWNKNDCPIQFWPQIDNVLFVMDKDSTCCHEFACAKCSSLNMNN